MKEVILPGAVLQVERTRQAYATTYHKVILLGGEWPDAEELITICDGNFQDGKFVKTHFGGKVEKYGNVALVEVYID